jgi:KDO2-lipid IV(A) lauroyltransferase
LAAGASPSHEPGDLREGGTWTAGQRLKNDTLYFLARAVLAIAERLPPSILRALGRNLGTALWFFDRRSRDVALQNVSRAFPELTPIARTAFVRRVFRELGALLGDVVSTLDPKRELPALPFLPGARECLEQAMAEGRGVVFASAHLGPWERVATSLVGAGIPLTVVAREPYDPRLGRIYHRLREVRGVRTVYRGADGAGIALVRVLRRGGVLGIPMDLASRVPSVDVPFLGSPAPTAVGPARLAIRTGAIVVVGTAARDESGRLGLSFVRVGDTLSETDLTARINTELSARIRAMPEAWPWMHRRWPHHPDPAR